MIIVNIRKQGGAAVMTIPADVLKILNIQIGAALKLDLTDDGFTVHTVQPKRIRYSLAELLEGVSQQEMDLLNAETAWARDGEPIGREII